jgi:competence protein ComEA
MKTRSIPAWMRTAAFALFLTPLGALATGGSPVNINTADAAALEQIKGLGPVKAKAIVDYRSAQGPFSSVDELVKVPGIGPKSVEAMRANLSTGPAPAPSAAATPAPAAGR